ncbi:DUF4221 family protein [Algoriphagus chordae]|uniref:Uncharacterized protein DUF4221 n=1 Tax=Algoriphagus chordae TaxID=237019 RepID=A0A2W7QFH7_9BACT|nr:DUF4221 family protein [Algoriphagus chordae]PZX47003.1 uncharacterized protein DUF4221 [Algoriphagus chordae]
MKRLFFYTTLFVSLYSCDNKTSSDSSISSSNTLENFSFSVDTLVVDVGEEIFMPGAYSIFALSDDADRVFTFYEPETEVHEIDLKNLKLLQRHRFEKDGPNMIPQFTSYMQQVNDDELFLANFYKSGIFKTSGEKTQTIPLQSEKYTGFDPDYSFTMGNSIRISADKKAVLFFPNAGIGAPDGLAVLNTEKMSGKLLPLPALEMSNKYRVSLKDGSVSLGQLQQTSWVNGQFLIYSGATSDIYVYEHLSDSLRLVTFPHEIVPKAKTGEFPTEFDSYEKMREVSNEINKQITFSEFLWDESRQMYFRMAQQNWQLNEVAMAYTADTYLFAYDQEFNLIGETEMDGLDFMFSGGFMREGKLYMRWVVGENPAFFVYTFDF